MKAAIQVLGAALLLIVLAACQGPYLMEIVQEQGKAPKAITAFSFKSPPATGTINENAKTIAVAVPYGTDVTALVATFTTTGSSVKVGSTVQVSGVTANNFTNPVIYMVADANGYTASYTVTVTMTVNLSGKAITAFSFKSPAATGTIDENAKAISVTVPYGTNVTTLVATFTTTGSSVKVGSTVQVSGTTANNFTNPVTYTVAAADGSTASYTVTVTTGPRSGLVAEYLFNGNAADTSGNGHNGVVHNATATSDRFGVPNRAYYFNNSYIEVSDPPGHLFNPNNSFSISAWLNLANDSALEHFPLIAQDEGPYSTNKWYFNYRTFDSNWNLFNAISFHVNSPLMGGGIRINSDPITLQLNTWHHVTLVRDGATFRFYVDSILKGNVTSDVVIPEVNHSLTIGYGELTEYLIGSADDIRIYDRALTAEEVSSLFHEGGWTGGGTALSGDKTITAFSFASPAATGTIDENAKTIAVTVPHGTNVTALVATFTTTGSSVKVGSAAQVSGTTANNFTNPVTYTVAAADGSTACYTVTVTVVGGSGSGGYITESGLVGTWTVSFQWSGRTPGVFTMVINADHTYQVPACPGVGASSGTLSISINGNSITMVESGPSSEGRTWTGTAASSTRFTGTLLTSNADNTGTFDACKVSASF